MHIILDKTAASKLYKLYISKTHRGTTGAVMDIFGYKKPLY